VMAGSEVIGQFVQTLPKPGIGAFGRSVRLRGLDRLRRRDGRHEAKEATPDVARFILTYVDVRTVLADQARLTKSQPARARAGDSVNADQLIAS